jgi:pimeloyl-ACP methyl ester carboxylesterase
MIMPEPSGTTERFTAQGGTLVVETPGSAAGKARLRLVWLHGWGQSRAAMAPLARGFEAGNINHLVDMPGFGEAPPPPQDWGTEQYGELLSAWLATLPKLPTVLIGHSFGGRVSVRTACKRSDLVDAAVLVAGAGLRRKRPLPARLRAQTIKLLIKGARAMDGLARTRFADGLRDRFGSADYRAAGVLRPVLVRTVTEDLSDLASRLRIPVLLVYGEQDDQTPPEFGRRYAELIPDSELALLPNFDHYTVLSTGRHQVHLRIRQFLDRCFGPASKDQASNDQASQGRTDRP